jgi:hypothetical protein
VFFVSCKFATTIYIKNIQFDILNNFVSYVSNYDQFCFMPPAFKGLDVNYWY